MKLSKVIDKLTHSFELKDTKKHVLLRTDGKSPIDSMYCVGDTMSLHVGTEVGCYHIYKEKGYPVLDVMFENSHEEPPLDNTWGSFCYAPLTLGIPLGSKSIPSMIIRLGRFKGKMGAEKGSPLKVLQQHLVKRIDKEGIIFTLGLDKNSFIEEEEECPLQVSIDPVEGEISVSRGIRRSCISSLVHVDPRHQFKTGFAPFNQGLTTLLRGFKKELDVTKPLSKKIIPTLFEKENRVSLLEDAFSLFTHQAHLDLNKTPVVIFGHILPGFRRDQNDIHCIALGMYKKDCRIITGTMEHAAGFKSLVSPSHIDGLMKLLPKLGVDGLEEGKEDYYGSNSFIFPCLVKGKEEEYKKVLDKWKANAFTQQLV